MEGLVVGGSTLVDVDDHGHFSSAAEKALEELGQLALSEGDVAALHPGAEGFGPPPTVRTAQSVWLDVWSCWQRPLPVGLVVAEGSDAFPQREQGGVDVAGLLQPLSKRLGSVASFRAGEVAQRKPSEGEGGG